jgi:hypothetical protein
MNEREEIERRLGEIRERNRKAREEVSELSKLSWIKWVQHPTNKKRLEKMELDQEEFFQKFIKREYPELKSEWNVLFYSFWKDLLAEKVPNMIEFMKRQKTLNKEKTDK